MPVHLATLTLSLCLLPLFGTGQLSGAEILPAKGSAKDGQFVLLELFSSEGCSSCPRAEEFLNAVVNEAEEKGLPVIGLAWHVDYWNKLKTHHGVWVDPYSDAFATKRQKRYSNQVPVHPKMKGRLVTPQFIVNGTHPKRAKDQSWPDFFKQLLSVERPQTIGLAWEADDTLAYTVDEAPAGCELLICTTQSHIVSDVTAGENHGRTLEHERVVRAMQRLEASSGKLAITLPEGVERQDAHVIALLQDSASMAVLAVREIALPAEKQAGLVDPPGMDLGTAVADDALGCENGVCVLPVTDDAGDNNDSTSAAKPTQINADR